MPGSPYSPDLSHRDDPATSNDAAAVAVASGTVATHEAAILAVLRTMPRGGTGKEIAGEVNRQFKHLRMNQVQVMRRIGVLVRRRQAHYRVNPCQPWRLNSKGRTVPNYLRRDGQRVHGYGDSDLPLFNV